MPTQYFTFYYDPILHGYDASMWRTLAGTPTVANQLRLSSATIAGYPQMLRGEYQFNINIPTLPATGNNRSFGLFRTGTEASILFKIVDTLFTATTTEDGSSTSVTIPWDPAWTDTSTEYKIRWEAGTAKFFIADTQVAVINDATVPNIAMGLYFSNSGADDMTIKYVNGYGLQYYYAPLPNITTTGPSTYLAQNEVITTQSVTLTEAVTVLITALRPSVSESVTVSENVAIVRI